MTKRDPDEAPPSVYWTACPCCGATAVRMAYDIGSGPELSCATCEWCWGVLGQDLQPLSPEVEL